MELVMSSHDLHLGLWTLSVRQSRSTGGSLRGASRTLMRQFLQGGLGSTMSSCELISAIVFVPRITKAAKDP